MDGPKLKLMWVTGSVLNFVNFDPIGICGGVRQQDQTGAASGHKTKEGVVAHAATLPDEEEEEDVELLPDEEEDVPP